MKLKVDKQSDALYFKLDESKVVESEQVQKDVILDYDSAGNVVGIELLHLSNRIAPELLKVLQFETA